MKRAQFHQLRDRNGRHIKVIREAIPAARARMVHADQRHSREPRQPAPEKAVAPSTQPTADDVARIVRGKTKFDKILWGEVIS